MPKNQYKQNMATEIGMNAAGQKNHVCMWDFHPGNPGLAVFYFLVGYCVSNEGMGGHT